MKTIAWTCPSWCRGGHDPADPGPSHIGVVTIPLSEGDWAKDLQKQLPIWGKDLALYVELGQGSDGPEGETWFSLGIDDSYLYIDMTPDQARQLRDALTSFLDGLEAGR